MIHTRIEQNRPDKTQVNANIIFIKKYIIFIKKFAELFRIVNSILKT